MKVYLICPVRNPTIDCTDLVAVAEKNGHVVHFPPRDVDQDDPTGERICREHLAAMKNCDQVWVAWDANSKGSHFDFGMAYALGKPIKLIWWAQEDKDGKSYFKVLQGLSK